MVNTHGCNYEEYLALWIKWSPFWEADVRKIYKCWLPSSNIGPCVTSLTWETVPIHNHSCTKVWLYHRVDHSLLFENESSIICKTSSHKDELCQHLLKFARDSGVDNFYKKYEKNLNFLHQGWFMLSLLEIGLVVLEKNAFLMISMYIW